MTNKEYQDKISDEIGKKEDRKQKSLNDPKTIWYGFGLFGLVGWSVAVPTLIGVFIGLWLDRQMNHPYTCTITGLLLGLMSGCWIAWNWIQREILANDEPKPFKDESQIADNEKTAD